MATEITLQAGGPRVNVDRNEALVIANRFEDESAHNTVIQVDLSCKCWPRPSLEVLRGVLTMTSSSVVILKLDDIIASLPTEEGLESLEFFADVYSNSPVVEIDLSDNALGSRGDQVLLPLFNLSTLKKLSIENCGMSKEVTQSLLTSIANKPLTHLKLGRNQIGSEGAVHVRTLVSTCPTLELFHYNGCRPGKEGTRFILKGLATMAESVATTSLVDLNLHDCTFDDDTDDTDEDNASSIDNLVLVLKKSPNLKKLNLQDGGEIGAEGLGRILQALVNSGAATGLVSLSLGGCELNEEGAETLAEVILSNSLSNLEELILDTNELGDSGVETLINALCSSGSTSLKRLNFECNEVGKSGARSLVNNHLPNLEELNVLDNMDIPLNWGSRLTAMYPTVMIDDDLEEGDESDDEEDQDVDDLANQLSDL